MKQNILLGKIILAIYLADDKMALKFEYNSPESAIIDTLIVLVDADCCSYTWIESVDNPEFLIGSPVLEARDLDLLTPNDEVDGEVIQFYGFKLSTIKGSCTIDYRNSSNGYYGGNLVWPQGDDSFYGGVFGGNVSKQVWNKIA